MARAAFGVTLGQSLGQGRFNVSSGAVTPVGSSVAAAVALEAAVTTAISDAEADPTISGNPTALGLVQDIGVAFVALQAATAAAATASAGKNAILDIDLAVLTTQNAVRAAMREIERAVASSGLAP